jgi:uncharacterized protein (UPF0335 family)
MAKAPKSAPPADGGRNNYTLSAEDLKDIEDRTKRIISLEEDRDEINADINAERKAIKAKGIDLDAWKASLKRFRMDPEQREKFDQSQANVNAALGVPIQADLFAETGDGGTLPAGLH